MHPTPSRSRVAALGLPLVLALSTTACATLGGSSRAEGPQSGAGGSCAVGSAMHRTELFFGQDRQGSTPVSDGEFQKFVDTTVTPLFKDGLTLLNANGQYLMGDGSLVHEGSKMMVLLHDGSEARSKDIDAIREAYKRQFQQEAVLRIDDVPCVAF